jgi:hypothetical protein
MLKDFCALQHLKTKVTFIPAHDLLYCVYNKMLDEKAKINISLPKINTRPALLRSEEFVPVIRTRRYNLLKIK